MLEELAEQVTGVPGSCVYYIEGDGPEYKLLIPGEPLSQYLGTSEQEAEQVLRAELRGTC